MLPGMRRSPHSRWSALAILLLTCACATTPAGSIPPPPEPSTGPDTTTAPTPSASATISASASTSPELVTWSQIDASGPAAREDHTWTVDPATGIVYLFGGRNGATVLGDTWAYDLATNAWSELAPEASPAGRFGHEAAWVEGIGLVIFAGQASIDSFFGDLWAYDPVANTWSELPATGALPTPRYGRAPPSAPTVGSGSATASHRTRRGSRTPAHTTSTRTRGPMRRRPRAGARSALPARLLVDR